MSHELLADVWFVLLGVLLIGYAILDGFDFGVGILHPVARSDEERRLMMNSIGPLWDGNEVWLVTFGGAMFAAFPTAYAAVFSGFYVPFMLLLFCLIFRAVSLEFRSKVEHARWRRVWDGGFFVASLGAALLLGVAAGAALQGIPIDAEGHVDMGVLDVLRPFPIVCGLMAVAMLAMHGAAYLLLKTEGPLRDRIVPWAWRSFFCFAGLFVVVTAWAIAAIPHATATIREHPWLWVVPLLNVLAVLNIPRSLHFGRPASAFVSTSCSIAAFCFLLMTALFPHMVVSSLDPAWSLGILESASSEGTLRIMLLIAVVGLPFVLAYTAVVYWTFRGKVQLGENSY